eukprot:210529-Prorocentrum_minimum.AAC.1
MLEQLRKQREQFETDRRMVLGGDSAALVAPGRGTGKTVHVTMTDKSGATYQVRTPPSDWSGPSFLPR